MEIYKDLGLNISNAINAREAGIYEVWTRLSTGRLKVFSTMVNFRGEYENYCRDEKGVIVKKNDHLMDVMRYVVMGRDKFSLPPIRDIVSDYRIRDALTGI
jgi:hypothetical protein